MSYESAGRPKLDPSKRRDQSLPGYFTVRERLFIQIKAEESGHKSVSDYIRTLILQDIMK
jgi:hypothetical protein